MVDMIVELNHLIEEFLLPLVIILRVMRTNHRVLSRTET